MGNTPGLLVPLLGVDMGEEGKATQHQGKSEEACRELRIHRLAADADADRLAADDRVSL